MFKYCSLYSGSSGNSFFIQSDNTNILVDVGVSLKKLTSALSSFDIDLNNIDAILITHEHSDHTKGLSSVLKKYNIPIYINKKTWESLDIIQDENENIVFFDILNEFKIGDFTIFPFPIPHDAANPCGFNICCENKKISIATDIGYISDELFNYLKYSTSILLESNYAQEVLKYSSYPYLLKRRIASNDGHLSNETAGKTIAKLYNYGLKGALLIHLSKENNFPELAYKTVINEIADCKDFSLNVAPRNEPSKMINVV